VVLRYMARAEEVGTVHAVARSGPWRRAEGALGVVDLVQDPTVPGGLTCCSMCSTTSWVLNDSEPAW
jgi:hypothetical protein